jgi:UDP-N-acetylmuramoylalanine--D-glutamate ligase
MATRALVYGLAAAGEAAARALLARGYDVAVADDRPTDAGLEVARQLGIDVYEKPSPVKLERLLARADVVVPSPGVPEHHALMTAAAAAGVPLRTEIDLAWEWEQRRPGGPRPMVAVTGTDGKTTTTLMAVAMCEASGRRAVACGNTEVPLVSALDLDVDVLVVECTSFRLAYTTCFAPQSAVWLNLAEDHLDWHVSLDSYAAAKARIWRFQGANDAAIGFADDPVVLAHLASAPARKLTFALDGADYHVADGQLTGPQGAIAPVASMRRSLPHDVTNALAASAAVLEAGVATVAGIASAVAGFAGVAHRISHVARAADVDWYDDSKATTPHAALTAIRAFPSVVLIAGGRNKDLDLRAMAGEPARMRAVVAIGDAAPAIAAAFAGLCPVETAGSMDDAVAAAAALARAGDAVLLSPGCASFDWYVGYGARGDDFARAVRAHLAGASR